MIEPDENESFDFYGRMLNGQEQMEPRWKRVINRMNHGLGEAVGSGGADRAGTANDHVFDCPRCLSEIARRDHFEFVRQEPLLDEQDRIVPGVKCHRPEMTGAAVEGDVQAISTLIFRILLSMLR